MRVEKIAEEEWEIRKRGEKEELAEMQTEMELYVLGSQWKVQCEQNWDPQEKPRWNKEEYSRSVSKKGN